MFGIGPWELMIVFAIVLLLFGGKRLPGIATGLGSAIRNFKNAARGDDTGDDKKLADTSPESKPQLPPAA